MEEKKKPNRPISVIYADAKQAITRQVGNTMAAYSRLQSRKLQRPVKHSRQLYRKSLILQNRLTQRSSNL